ncbi:MAG: acetyl-CoA acetyltransferase [Sphingobium sp.]
MTPAIIGWGHSAFGKLQGETVESLIVSVACEALAHAGVAARDVDEMVLGHFNAGFSEQDFTSALILQADPGLRFKPATRTENACASGAAAVFQGVRAIEAGRARIVLVVGAEKMTDATGPQVGRNLLRAAYLAGEEGGDAGFAGVFGTIAEAYFARHGDQSEALAKIAVKNHANGMFNPFAQLHKPLTLDFCMTDSERNPRVAGPLRRSDCSPVSDGAAALVIADAETARTMRRAIAFRGMSHVQDYLPLARRDILEFEGCMRAWRAALGEAKISLDDLSFVETHDCFTIAELLEYEAMGLAAPGRGADAIHEGRVLPGGKLPVNLSGGLKAKGHPIGATGVSMHVLSSAQLCGEAPAEVQVADPKLAGIFNMGGAGVANYASILERVR